MSGNFLGFGSASLAACLFGRMLLLSQACILSQSRGSPRWERSDVDAVKEKQMLGTGTGANFVRQKCPWVPNYMFFVFFCLGWMGYRVPNVWVRERTTSLS
jgi:hypothetical protein